MSEESSHFMKHHRRVFRYVVPVDDHSYQIGDGPVTMVTTLRDAIAEPAKAVGILEVWVEVSLPVTSEEPKHRLVQVFGTGHQLPEKSQWLGSCLDGPLVWHLYEIDHEEHTPEDL